MTDRAISEQLRIVKVTIESVLPSPCRIAVIAATGADGTTELTFGLAKAFAASGVRTAGILASRELQRSLDRQTVSESLHTYKFSHDGDLAFATVERVVEQAETRYDVVIVDGGPVAEKSDSLRIAAKSDGVIVAVRLGRRVSDADRELPRLLSRVGARMLGIVTLDPLWLAETQAGTDAAGVRPLVARDVRAAGERV